MAYDEGVAERLREVFNSVPDVTENKMFGGIAFMVNGHMSCGVVKDLLMVRVGPDQYEDALNKSHAKEMDFTGRPLKGFVYVEPDGFAREEDLQGWVAMSLKFTQGLPPKS